jgi:hypothetical protein
MNKAEILKRLDALLDEAAKTRRWGEITLELRDGVVCVIRTTNVDKVSNHPNQGGYPHGKPRYESR